MWGNGMEGEERLYSFINDGTIESFQGQRHLKIEKATYTTKSLDNLIIFPNPYKLPKHKGCGITFRNLTPFATIKTFNISGELIETFNVWPEHYGEYKWMNPETRVASGVYISIITNPQGEKEIKKIGIIK